MVKYIDSVVRHDASNPILNNQDRIKHNTKKRERRVKYKTIA